MPALGRGGPLVYADFPGETGAPPPLLWVPALGLDVAPLAAAALALSIYVSAYLGEIWRGCIESVPRTQAEAAVGEPIVLAVSSDVADSIHVHSIPEHVFEVQPRPAQRFEFTVDVPGSVDVELHDLNRTIVTIAVRP